MSATLFDCDHCDTTRRTDLPTRLALDLERVESVTVHCFDQRCAHVTTGTPDEAHRHMEAHYTAKHARQIARIVAS